MYAIKKLFIHTVSVQLRHDKTHALFVSTTTQFKFYKYKLFTPQNLSIFKLTCCKNGVTLIAIQLHTYRFTLSEIPVREKVLKMLFCYF